MFGAIPLFGSFCTNVFFPLVIQQCTVCRHLFISNARMSWMEGDFLNQKPCIPSWPAVCQFYIFLSVTLSISVCIYAFGFSSSHFSYLVILFIDPSFSLCLSLLLLPYFCPKSWVFFFIWLLVCFIQLYSQFQILFSFIVLAYPVLSVLFYPLSISF